MESMDPLTQLRLFKGDARLTAREIRILLSGKDFLFKKTHKEPLFAKETIEVHGGAIGSLVLSVDFGNDIVAYRTKQCSEPVVLGARGLDYRKYFDVIKKSDCLYGPEIEPGHGYLFGTTETCAIPGNLAAEVVAIDERFGEIRSHFAGFIDPGFGDPNNPLSNGNSITLEVMAYENGVTLRNQQAIGMLCLEYMSTIPQKLYQGNYAKQLSGPKLPKQFTTL